MSAGPYVEDGRAYPRFAMVLTEDLMSDEVQALSAAALRTWMALIAIAGGHSEGFRASMEKLEEMTGASLRQIYRALVDLERAELVKRVRTGRSSRFILTSPGQEARHGGRAEEKKSSKKKKKNDSKNGDRDVTSQPDEAQNRGDTDVTPEVTPTDIFEVTDLSPEPDDKERKTPEIEALQTEDRSGTDLSSLNPSMGNEDETGTTVSDQDASEPGTSRPDVMESGRTSSPLSRTAFGRLIEDWVFSQLDGLTCQTWERKRDVVRFKLEAIDSGLIDFLVDGMAYKGPRRHKRTSACKSFTKLQTDALAHVESLPVPPFNCTAAFHGLWPELQEAGLRGAANACTSEEEASDVRRLLALRQAGLA